jgi:phage terminase large subunit
MQKVIRDVLNMDVSPVFIANQRATKRIVINQGGMRSGKTYSILQALIYIALLLPRSAKRKIIDVVRKTKAEMHDTVLRDFIDILKESGLYDKRYHNKTHDEFLINGCLFRFIGLDKAQKKRGSKRDILYINECNGLSLEDWVQLSGRTAERIYLDFNPSEYFWLNEHILEKRTDFDFIKSTYLDNYDFLPAEQILEIENLINIDDYYYKVYVLGELAEFKGKIYKNYEFVDPDFYNAIDYEERFYGLDLGYENATALVEIKYFQEKVYEREIYYKEKKTDEDLLEFMLDKDISMTDDIYIDPAAAATRSKLLNAGFNIRKAKKDVRDGIRFCQGLKRFVCKSSTNYSKELSRYKWKQTSDGKVIEGEPVKIDDHAVDAVRYGEYTHLKRLAA